jgi:hypothetical protein
MKSLKHKNRITLHKFHERFYIWHMMRNIKYLARTLAVSSLMVLLAFGDVQPERPTTGFFSMKGEFVSHPFTSDRLDSLSGHEIYELRDSAGVPVWFGRHIFKDVCITGECKMMRLWLFWDGAGNYLGFQIPEGEPLTKSDHTEFEEADYKKLHVIMSDPESLLKDLKTEDLTEKPTVENPFEVDGYTAATKPGLDEVVVKDAVYTCHTLWHTVYGPTRQEILRLAGERVSPAYLTKMFENGSPALISWAIEKIATRSEYHEEFYPHILKAILSDNNKLSHQALSYFSAEKLVNEKIQLEMANLIPEVGAQKKYDIIWKLAESGKVQEKTALTLLEHFDNQKIGIGSLNLVYKLVEPEFIHKNPKINDLLNKLAASENAYIRNLTSRLLSQAK